MTVTLAAAVRCGNKPPSWMTYPSRRRNSPTVAGLTVWPSTSTAPVVGVTSPAISRSTVDLPDPLGPSRAVVRRGSNVRSVGASATRSP